MPDGCFDLIVAPQPFTPRVEAATVPAGLTLAALLTRACIAGTLDPQDLARTELYLDGVLLADREAALDVRPAEGQVVNVVVMPQGGGHGGAKALEAALQVAIMVAAFAVAGPGSPLASSLAQAGIKGASAVAIEAAAMATVNLAGSVALAAIFGNLNKQATTSPTYNLESQTNQPRPREPMPLQCGGGRTAFDVAASAYTSTIGDDQYITAIYGLHYGPCAADLIKIGETLISAYPSDELQVEYFLTPGPRNSTLYPSKIYQQSFQNQLDPLHADITTETTGVDPASSFEVDLYWPALYYTKGDGSQVDELSRVLIEYSPHGANTWSPVPGLPTGVDKSGFHYPAGTYYLVANQKNPIRRTVAWTAPAGQYDVRMSRNIRPGGDTSRDTDDVYWTALRSINTDEPAIRDETLSVIVLRAKASQDFSGSLGTVSGVVTPIVPLFDADTGLWQGDPTAYDAATWGPSSNAAAIARYMLTGYPAAVPLLASEIDASFGDHYALIEQRAWTGAVRIAEQASQVDALGKLAKLGRCSFFWNGQAMVCVPDYEKPAGRQLFSGRNAKNYSYKRIFPDPVHAVWVEFANADEDWKSDGLFVYADGYAAVADDAHQAAALLEKLPLDYACTGDRAYREGRVYLAKRKLLTETHQWDCGVESVASAYGDRVAVRSVSTAFGIGEGRVLNRLFSGALVAGVRLDTEVTFQDGVAYAIDARRADVVLRGLDLTTSAGRTRDLFFAAPLAEDAAPERDDLVVVGEVNVITEDVELVDVTPQADGTAKLVAQAYRWDDIIAAETGPIPALQSRLTARVPAPVPTIQGAQGSPDGVAVAFTVAAQRQATIAGFQARWRRSPSEDASSAWNSLPLLGANASVVQTPPIAGAQYQPGDVANEYRVDVEIRTVLTTGELSQPAQALNILVQQGVYAPTNFAALGVVRAADADDGSSYPAIQITCDALTAGSTSLLQIEMQPAGSNPSAWLAIPNPFHADNPNGDITGVLGGSSYDVRGRWHTSDNWNSDWVVVSGVAVPSGALVAANVAKVGDQTVAQIQATLAAAAAATGQITDAINKAEAALEASNALAQNSQDQAYGLLQANLNQALAGVQAFEDRFTPTGLPAGPVIEQNQTDIYQVVTQVISNSNVTDAAFAAQAAALGTLETEVTALTSDYDGFAASTQQSLTALTTAAAAETQARLNLAASVANNKASADAGLATLTTLVSAETQARLDLASVVGANQASAASQFATLVNQTQALSADYISLNSQFLSNVASVQQSLAALTTATSAETQARLDLASVVGANKATADSEFQTQASEIATGAANFVNLNAQFLSNVASVQQSLAALTTATSAETQARLDLASVVGANKATADSEFQTQASQIATGAANFTTLNAQFLSNVSSVQQSLAALTTATTAETTARLALAAVVGANKSEADTTLAALTDSQSSLAASLTQLTTNFDGFEASANSSLYALSTAASAETQARLDLASVVGANKAAADTSLATVVNNTEALSTNFSNLNAQFNGNVADQQALNSAFANADTAEAAARLALATTVANNKATADTELLTLTTAQSALSSSLTDLTATVGGNYSTLSAGLAVVANDVSTGATNFANLDSQFLSNVAYQNAQFSTFADANTAEAAARLALATAVANNKATADNDFATLSTLTASQASQLSTLTAAVNDNEASISSYALALANLSGTVSAVVGLSLDVNGHVVGYRAANDGTTGTFTATFDGFQLLTPAGVSLFQASGDTVKMPNVEVDTLKVNSIGNAALAPGQVTGSFYAYDGTTQDIGSASAPPAATPTGGQVGSGGGGYSRTQADAA